MANIGKKTEHKIPAVLPQINKGAAAPLSADLNTFKPATKNEIAHSLAQPTSSLNSHQIKALEKPKDVESYKQEVETSFVSELGKANILKAVPWFAVGMGLFYKAVPKIAYALEANTKSTGIFEDPVAKIPQIANIPHKILANKITQNKGAVDGIETFSSFANVFMNSFNYRNNKAKTRGFASLFHKFSKILTIPRSLLNSSLMLTVGLPNLLSFGAFQLKEKDKALALKSLAKPFENLVGLSKSLNDLDRLNHGKGSTLNATAGLYFNSCLAHKDFDKTIRELNQKDENGESIVSQNLRVLGVSEHIIQTVDKNISKIINLFVKETDNDNESSHFDTELGTMKPKAVIREVLTYASQLLDRHDRYISDRTDGLLEFLDNFSHWLIRMPLRIQILNKGVRLLSLAINNQSVRIKQVEEFKKIAELGATNDMAQFAIKQSVQKGLFRAPVDKAGKIRQLKKQEEISDTIQTYIGFIRKFPIVGVLVSPILNTFESAFKPKLDDYYQELDPSELEIM